MSDVGLYSNYMNKQYAKYAVGIVGICMPTFQYHTPGEVLQLIGDMKHPVFYSVEENPEYTGQDDAAAAPSQSQFKSLNLTNFMQNSKL